jgi:hypothetical protein
MQAFRDALAQQLNISTDRLDQAMSAARQQAGMNGQWQRPNGAGQQGQRFGRGGGILSVAAQAIGVTPEQLRQELHGSSLAAVAQAHGKNPADVATALKNASNQRIDERMTQTLPTGGRGAFHHRGAAAS